MNLRHLILYFIFPLQLISAAIDPFPDDIPMNVGAYYYPEQWDPSQWDRDLENMANLGFQFTHFAEFAWSKLEPEDGRFDFEWLDRAVELAQHHGLKIILCTQSCAPPAWMVEAHPDVLLTDINGRRKEHGTRANMSFANPVYRQYVERMTREIGKRYGNHPAVAGWQLHNEPYGHYDYSECAQLRFRDWLRAKYTSIEQLNEAWGNAFWSQEYQSFDQIRIPNTALLDGGINPHQLADYYNYNADEVAGFLDLQASVLKEMITPKQWITTNYISGVESADARRTQVLDFPSFTCYIVFGNEGMGETGFRIGNPNLIDFGSAFLKPIRGTTGIMELQPGQVNWGAINPQPLPGAVRLWLWHAYARGNNFVCTYRYRQPLSGSEQYHYGIMRPDGISLSPGGKEYMDFIEELNKVKFARPSDTPTPAELEQRRTAILWTHDNRWDLNISKRSILWNNEAHLYKYLNALRTIGATFDLISETQDLSSYSTLIVPAYQKVDSELVQKWTQFAENGGNLIITCRTGHRDMNGHLWEGAWSQPILDLIGADIEFYDCLPADHTGTVEFEGKNYKWNSWAEVMVPRPGTRALATHQSEYYEGQAVATRRKLEKGTVTYIGIDSQNGDLEKELVRRAMEANNIPTESYPEGIIKCYRDGLHILLNYTSSPYSAKIPKQSEVVIGTHVLPPAGVLVWKQ